MQFLGLGVAELILILAVLLLFFGKDKLPELAKSIGKSFRELKSGLEDSTKNAQKPTDKKEKAHQTTGSSES